MSSITPTSFSSSFSPLQMLQNELTSEVSNGTISSSDQSALSSALNDINSSLTGNTGSSGASSGPPSPQAMKSKIDGLISQEVQSGKLTSNQATELQNVFANAFSKGPPPGGAAGGGAGILADASTSASSGSANSAFGSSTDSSNSESALSAFLQALQSSYGQATSYNSTGQSQTADTVSALVVNYQS